MDYLTYNDSYKLDYMAWNDPYKLESLARNFPYKTIIINELIINIKNNTSRKYLFHLYSSDLDKSLDKIK